MFILGCSIATYAQVIQLEETELTFQPTTEVLFEDYSKGVLKVRETYAQQFQSNAIKFLVDNFDIHKFLRENEEEADEFLVSVKSSKGYLHATYNKDGKLLKTSQVFKNIPLSVDIRNQVYGQYKGWTILKNKYVASGRLQNIDSEKYIIHLENGKQKERIKVTPLQNRATGVAYMIERD